MTDLILPHRLDDGAAALVGLWQAFEVIFQMFLDLPLGLGDEAQAGTIARQARERPDGE